VKMTSTYHGISRSIAWKAISDQRSAISAIKKLEADWKSVGESTSAHLRILGSTIDESGDYIFLTINADTSEAMGMNMITIAAQAIGDFIAKECGYELITIAANVDSDKKPSTRTHKLGRGYEVKAEAVIPSSVIESVLKTTPEKMLQVADAKLNHGSKLANAIGSNLHAANVIAALYLATGQDAAHVVEGSMCDTTVKAVSGQRSAKSLHVSVRLPAILVGVRGGGTQLPAQSQCLNLLLGSADHSTLNADRPRRLAESIGAAVLAGELSLLAAQATQELAKSHKKLAR